jgi:photosystem II stability/assembly factor-like uncharacterized protein
MAGDSDPRLRRTIRPTGTPSSPARLLVLLALVPAFILSAVPAQSATPADTDAWMSGGPTAGLAHSIAIAPSDPSVVYAATSSGVYASSDHGGNWSTTGLREVELRTVRVDPVDPDLVYALTAASPTSKLLRSTNGGQDWTQRELAGAQTLDIDPSNPAVLWLGTDTGRLHRSADRGDTWTQVLHKQYRAWTAGEYVYYDHPITSVLVDPEDSDRVFLALDRGVDSGAFGRTDDGGLTWEFSQVGRLTPDAARNLAVTPAGYAPQALFILSSGDSSVGYTDAVYRSLDKGETWEMVSGYVGSTIVVHPSQPHRLLLGTTSDVNPLVILDHTDHTWVGASAGLPGSAPDTIAVSPDGSGIAHVGYASGRLYRSLDDGLTWGVPPGGIANANVTDIAISPSDPATAVTAVDGQFRLQRTSTGGVTWSELANSPERAGVIAIDPTNEARMFVGTSYIGGLLYRTQDGGSSWTRIDESSFSGPFRDIWIHPDQPDVILALKDDRTIGSTIYYGGVRRSTNGGTSWTQVRNWWRPTTLASDPSNHDVVYLGLGRLGYVERSTDAGLTWTNISPYAEWAWTVNDIVVGSDSKVYAATTDYQDNALGGLWRWDGSDWSRLMRFGDTTVTALAIDHVTSPDTLYAGTDDQGVLVSKDGGTSWTAFNPGLGMMHITELEVSSARPTTLYAGTRHGGVWSISVDRPSTQPPSVTITSGPEGVVEATSAEFTFVADVGGAAFECRLNEGAWTPCESPVTYTGLSAGTHTFQVRATADGLTGEVASRTWTVDLPPDAPLACPPGLVPVAPFTDVSRDGVHTPAIDCAVWYGIAQGRTPTSYAPTLTVNRAQMASFVARLIEAGGGTLPPATPQGFTDLDSAGVHAQRINQLAAAGIVRGTSPTTYSPQNQVTRAQMATFLVNAYEYVSSIQLPIGATSFTDIAGNTHETNIRKAATAGFARGTTPTTYAPTNPVRRDQMASFLTRVLERFATDGNTLRHLR